MSENKTVIHSVFAVPIIQFSFENHSKYNFKGVDKSTRRPADWKCDVQTSFPDIREDDALIDPHDAEKLKSDITDSISSRLHDLEIHWPWSIKNFWYNIYHTGQWQEQHDHLGGDKVNLCGIYYNRGTSPTVFSRADLLQRINYHPSFDSSRLAPFFFDQWWPGVSEGDIILFPPYLPHRVPPVEGPDYRLTFSFNISMD